MNMDKSPIYEPDVHKPPNQNEIEQIIKDLNLGCTPTMLQAIQEKAAGAVKSLQALDRLVDVVPEVKYPRTPGYKPDPRDSIGNAWTWRCDIKGAPEGKLRLKTLAIKDCCAVAGVPMANGSKILEGYIPEYDATVVTRILDAGGHIVGKSSCDDCCRGAIGFSSMDGYVTMLGKPNMRAGGSSAGSAVLVATGEVDMALGTDQGGSIRGPAALTGIVGLKPTYGLVPYTGLISLDPLLDHVGPMARNVRDCALLLEVLAGPDGLDGRQLVTEKPVPNYSQLLQNTALGKVTLGLLHEGFICGPCNKAMTLCFESFVNNEVKIAGFNTRHISVPLHTQASHIKAGLETAMLNGGTTTHMRGFYSTSLEKALRDGAKTCAPLLAPGITIANVNGEMIRRRHGSYYYTKARNLCLKLSDQYDEALKQCDVILMPTLPFVERQLVTVKGSTHEANVQAELDYLNDSFSTGANLFAADLTGHPALSLPVPVPSICGARSKFAGVMLVGKKFDELTVLKVARALEKVIDL